MWFPNQFLFEKDREIVPTFVPSVLPIQVSGTMVLLKLAVKYLGIMTDMKMSFFEQIFSTEDKIGARMFVSF